MVQLINVSSADCDICNLPGGTPQGVEFLLQRYGLDGIEFMVCDAKDTGLFPRRIVRGVHLWFYPSWMHFWHGNAELLARDYSPEQVRCIFGDSREEWLMRFRDNFRVAGACGAEYAIFHVAHAGQSEIFSRNFFYDDRDVVEGTIEVVRELVSALPQDCMLLYENLWWPGLTFRDPVLAARLIEETPHEHTGFMLDTGHLMNTNWDLRTEEEGVDYVLDTIEGLARYDKELAERIRGLHLHQSLSGAYARTVQEAARRGEMPEHPTPQESIDYVLRIDRHAPLHTPRAREIIDRVRPHWLVHEFIPTDTTDWEEKLAAQTAAIR
ncbi:sugar phosphate isomerase/epimerase family protein [Selenomonas artemidis]|uniref:sugar phosphate isomerase/epimerase family protein n=1 Tax=Selenomonas artemidis TaxID=671224 RepID=UPI00288BD6C0|nr:TIM barrel protein [Selenomonas artemidis]